MASRPPRRHDVPYNLEHANAENVMAVDSYFESTLLPSDPALESALEANSAAGLDSIDVAPNQGRMLYLLAKMVQAKKILEVGTLGGYSATWFAKALAPNNGHLTTLEIDPNSAAIAQSNLQKASLSQLVTIRVGPALETLSKMEKQEGWGASEDKVFDMVFIDADKVNNLPYYEYAMKFAGAGALIVVDNVVRRGKVASEQEGEKDEVVKGIRNALERMGKDERLEATALQTVGCKGWDGFAMGLVVKK